MKILVRLPNWLGDVVMASAFINVLPQYYPDCLIDVIVKKELSGIAELIPNINKCYPFNKQSFKGINGAYQFGKTLKAEKYDFMFNLPHSISSSLMAVGVGAKKSISI
jgi:ADP-heptose:LPS heptosyltransferase